MLSPKSPGGPARRRAVPLRRLLFGVGLSAGHRAFALLPSCLRRYRRLCNDRVITQSNIRLIAARDLQTDLCAFFERSAHRAVLLVDALRHRTEALQQEGGPAEGEADKAPTAQAVVPEQREGIRSFLIPFEPEHHTNGATPPADPTGTARQS